MLIQSIGGQARVMNNIHAVRFEDGVLTIAGLDFERAMGIIQFLEANSTVQVPAQDALPPAAHANGAAQAQINGRTILPHDTAPTVGGISRPQPTVDRTKIAALAAGSPAKPPKPEKVEKPKKAKAAEAAPEAEEEMEDNGQGVMVPKGHAARVEAEHGPVDSSPIEDDAEEQEEEKPAAKANGAGPKVSEKIMQAKKLRDVLQFLNEEQQEAGVEDETARKEAVKEKCLAIKDAVPCLARINDLDGRIDRTLVVMDLNDTDLS